MIIRIDSLTGIYKITIPLLIYYYIILMLRRIHRARGDSDVLVPGNGNELIQYVYILDLVQFTIKLIGIM